MLLSSYARYFPEVRLRFGAFKFIESRQSASDISTKIRWRFWLGLYALGDIVTIRRNSGFKIARQVTETPSPKRL